MTKNPLDFTKIEATLKPVMGDELELERPYENCIRVVVRVAVGYPESIDLQYKETVWDGFHAQRTDKPFLLSGQGKGLRYRDPDKALIQLVKMVGQLRAKLAQGRAERLKVKTAMIELTDKLKKHGLPVKQEKCSDSSLTVGSIEVSLQPNDGSFNIEVAGLSIEDVVRIAKVISSR
ncbi:MAG: hypothetical protein Q8K86_05955 [Candidatus Nanopelagicaceae bacterium]|nr:hypothetical protein [Candidatus Nanopelagicaceae bacterium]